MIYQVVFSREADEELERLFDHPDGHPKPPHLWPVKLLQAGQGGL